MSDNDIVVAGEGGELGEGQGEGEEEEGVPGGEARLEGGRGREAEAGSTPAG
jgi:hypothetical protein